MRPALALGLLLAAPALAPAGILLYDPTAGTLPAGQPWLDFAAGGGSASQTGVPGSGVRLVTDAAASAGYSNYRLLPPGLKNPAFPVLDRAAGFALDFAVEVNSEEHSSNDRAGFSVILLAADRRGIELGFWEDRVFAQAVGFTQAEFAPFDTTAATDYRLTVLGDGYRLTAGGNLLLAGTLRDYGPPALPYDLPNFLFLGDDTSRAAADVTLGRVALVTAVPEPSSAVLVGVGAAGLVARRRRRAVAGGVIAD